VTASLRPSPFGDTARGDRTRLDTVRSTVTCNVRVTVVRRLLAVRMIA
jgi:hypothetical protein